MPVVVVYILSYSQCKFMCHLFCCSLGEYNTYTRKKNGTWYECVCILWTVHRLGIMLNDNHLSSEYLCKLRQIQDSINWRQEIFSKLTFNERTLHAIFCALNASNKNELRVGLNGFEFTSPDSFRDLWMSFSERIWYANPFHTTIFHSVCIDF